MSGITGYPSQKKLTTNLTPYTGGESRSNFNTLQPTNSDRVLQDSVALGAYVVNGAPLALASVSAYPKRVLNITAHGASRGDFVRFRAGSSNAGFESSVLSVPDANTIILAGELNSNSIITDTVDVLRYITPQLNADGTQIVTIAAAPIEFLLDSVSTQVSQDTVTPANSIPLPVAVLNTAGVPVSPATEATLLALLAAKNLQYKSSARLDYSVTNVDNTNWTEVIASVGGDIILAITVLDSSGYTMELGIGAATSETRTLLIPLGGLTDGQLRMQIPAGSRISVRAVGAALVSTGELVLNFFK